MQPKAHDLNPIENDTDDSDDGDISRRLLSPLEVASYVDGMAAEMRIMARDAKLNALSYFLEMVRVEASAEIERQARADQRFS